MSGISLAKQYRRFLVETAWLLESFDVARSTLHTSESGLHRLGGEMTVVRLHDAWARFCRELVVTSASCKPYTATGIQLRRAPGVKRRADAIPTLMSKYSKRKFEPRWADAAECIGAARHLQIANLSTISAAIGAINSPVDDLRHVRNFFAHRWKGTANKIKALSFYNPSINLNLEDLVGQIVPPGITRMESWIIDLRLVAEAAIQ